MTENRNAFWLIFYKRARLRCNVYSMRVFYLNEEFAPSLSFGVTVCWTGVANSVFCVKADIVEKRTCSLRKRSYGTNMAANMINNLSFIQQNN